MIKILNAHLADAFKLELDFSDHTHGVFDANAYLASRSGPLLDKLHEPDYFKRFFIAAGALCWPNGLEISPARLHEICVASVAAQTVGPNFGRPWPSIWQAGYMTRSDSGALAWLGSPNCGLVGPCSFPFQWTFQRNRGGRHSTRQTAHHHFPQMKGQAMFVEAVTPPLRHIRHAALELVDTAWDLFFVSGAFDPGILSPLGSGAHWDMLQPILPQQCPREGTRLLLEWVRTRFAHRYAGWQALALRNGRFFPVPVRWELVVDTHGCVQVLLGWSTGFTPADRNLVIQRIAVFIPNEPVLPHQARKVTKWC